MQIKEKISLWCHTWQEYKFISFHPTRDSTQYNISIINNSSNYWLYKTPSCAQYNHITGLASGNIKSWVQLKLQSRRPHFHHRLKSASFSFSKDNKQRGLAKYQLHMEEAKRGIYIIGNSLIEGFGVGHISIRKGQQKTLHIWTNIGQFDWTGISRNTLLFGLERIKVKRRCSCKNNVAAVIAWH